MNMRTPDVIVPRWATLDDIFPSPAFTHAPVYVPSYLTLDRGARIKQALVPLPPRAHAEQVCLICTSSYGESSAALTVLACNHAFHVDCIVPWFERSPTCPLCRRVTF